MIHRAFQYFPAAALLLVSSLNAASESSAVIKVDLAAPKAAIPGTLHGIFLEEISHAFDGGLYAELIQNRSFEEGVLPPGMKLVKQPDGSLKMELEKLPAGVPEDKWPMPWPWGNNCVWKPERELLAWSFDKRGGASGEMKITEANPMNAASSRSLAMKVDATSTGSSVALANSGYWGISIQSGTSYDLKFYLLPTAFDGVVTATLESKDGKILGKHEFGRITPGKSWKRHTAKISATGTDPQARLVLSFSGKGSLQIDWVSLFPPTYKNRPNGLRPDLAKYLEDLKPSFIRYPGGCYVEGLSWESAPDWRKMVCPPEDRPGQWGYWQYRSTDGFGYHEFLQFCEDIGADAMYVAFCGMTVHPENNMPLDQIGPVIQQTLDAIEYATGPVTSKWGAVRAKMGHPKPFPLKYVEIGNEHPPAIYGDYYVKFRQTIKAKYPDMNVIMSMFWSGLNPAAIERAGDANIDIVDEHAYRDASWIRTNFDYFDKYPRKPWKIYVGEYASHHGAGDWYGGMGDSLYLMMCERNGDLVKMASYAPLFCNVNLRDWGINLIEFDSSRSYAHASYYVQKMFAENRPDVNLGVSYETLPKPDPAEPLFGGWFGLGSTNSQVEFKDIRITDSQGTVIAGDDFQSIAKWDSPVAGTWQAEGGVLKQTDGSVGAAMIFMKYFELRTGKVTLKARRTGGNDAFNLIFNFKGGDNYVYSNCGSGGNKWCDILQRGERGDQMFQKLLFTDKGLENGRWYDVTLDVGVSKAELFLDGKKVGESNVIHPSTLFANAGYEEKSKTVILKATNYQKTPLTTEVTLDGVANVAPTGGHLFMTSAEPYAENSFESPRLIVPQEVELKGCAPRFTVTLPPNSVNVLRIPASRTPNP
jgi:alpha-L-arabinofuranosidase